MYNLLEKISSVGLLAPTITLHGPGLEGLFLIVILILILISHGPRSQPELHDVPCGALDLHEAL